MILPIDYGFIYDQLKSPRSSVYTEDDADPVIKQHAIHWLICMETYKSERNPVLGRSQRWALGLNLPETCTYTDTETDTIIVGFRGTKETKDIYDDMKLSLDEVFPRGQEAIQLVRNLVSQNPDFRIELCGHSLGGAIARVTGAEFGFTTVTFNAAAPPTAPVVTGDNEVDYHIVFDIISAWQSPNTTRIDKGYRPIANFFQRMNFYTWLYGSLSDVLEAHKLTNFSEDIDRKIISAKEEDALFREWLNSLPYELKTSVFLILFGTQNSFYMPEIK
jgi:hypothetical protein